MIDRARAGMSLSRRPAFVLMIVCVLLVIVGVTVVQTVRMSLRRAVAALASEEALQERWGMFSIERTLLPAALSLFTGLDEARQKRPGLPRSRLLQTHQLGSIRFETLLADEEAKANLNVIHHLKGPGAVQRAMLQAIAAPLRLRPEVMPMQLGNRSEITLDLPPAYRSWGQVFDLTADNVYRQLPAVTQNWTCWGTGRLNARRAEDAALRAVLSQILPTEKANRLIRQFRQTELAGWEQAVEKVGVSDTDRQRLGILVSEQSASYSVWITSQSPHRQARHMTVGVHDDQGTLRTLRVAE